MCNTLEDGCNTLDDMCNTLEDMCNTLESMCNTLENECGILYYRVDKYGMKEDSCGLIKLYYKTEVEAFILPKEKSLIRCLGFVSFSVCG